MKKLLLVALCIVSRLHSMEIDPNSQLLEAAKRGTIQLVEQALKDGADINTQGQSGLTPLMLASLRNNDQIVEFLLAAGADVNMTDIDPDLEGWTALFWASSKGNVGVVRRLLEYGARVNITDYSGRTALMEACQNGKSETVKFLLAYGADIHAKTAGGSTALSEASRYSYPQDDSWTEVIHLLLTLQDFLDNPREQMRAHPLKVYYYFVWSIAYKKDDALNYLTENHQLLISTKSLVEFFMLAARNGNAYALNRLASMVKSRNPDGLKFIYLKAIETMMKLHPELLYLVHQFLAEEIAPANA